MSHQYSQTVEQLIRERMASGRYASEDDLLIDALQSLSTDEEELQAIQEGINSIKQGDKGVGLDSAFKHLRGKYDVKSDA